MLILSTVEVVRFFYPFFCFLPQNQRDRRMARYVLQGGVLRGGASRSLMSEF